MHVLAFESPVRAQYRERRLATASGEQLDRARASSPPPFSALEGRRHDFVGASIAGKVRRLALERTSSLLVRERGNGSELLKVSQFALVFFQSTRDGLSELDAALARGDLALMRELGHGSRRRPRSSVRAAWRNCARTWKICQNPTSKRT